MHDFPGTSDCFPGLNIRGGVCYFLWEKEHDDDCLVFNHIGDNIGNPVKRPLLEKGSEVFIRYNEAISILRKVKKQTEGSFSEYVSSHKAFGLRTYVKGERNSFHNSIKLYRNRGIGYVKRDEIIKNNQWIDKWKVIVPYSSPGDDSYPHLILSSPLISEPGSCSTETYLVVGPFKTKKTCTNVVSYMKTRLVRFLILLIKPSQHVTKKTYQFVPSQNFDESWTNEKLYKKYKLTKDEITFIESKIKPME